MRKYWKQFAVITLSGLLLLTGCSSDPQPTSDNKKEEAKELTTAEILEKASESMKKNLTYETNMIEKVDIDANGIKINDQYTTNMAVNMANGNFHAKGHMTADGKQSPAEMYRIDNILYQNTADTNGWTKTTVDNKTDTDQDPSVPVKEFEEILKELIKEIDGNNLPKGTTFNKETNTSLLEINYNELENTEETTKEIREELIAALKEIASDDLAAKLTPDKVQIDKAIFKFHIDNKTYQVTKLEREIVIGLNIDQFKVNTTSLSTIDIKGEFNGTIELPEEVKTQAK